MVFCITVGCIVELMKDFSKSMTKVDCEAKRLVSISVPFHTFPPSKSSDRPSGLIMEASQTTRVKSGIQISSVDATMKKMRVTTY